MAQNNHQLSVVIPTEFLQRVTPTFVSGLVDKAYQMYESNKAKVRAAVNGVAAWC